MTRLHIINRLILPVLALLISTAQLKGQCAGTITHTTGANGGVTYSLAGMSAMSYTLMWQFGNGINSGALPTVTAATQYTANGVYTVTLNLQTTSPNCNTVVTQTVSITNAGCLTPTINWTTGANGTATFTAGIGSVGSYSLNWNFGNGSGSVSTTSQSTSTQYTANGIYTITLVASTFSPNCFSGAITQTINITNAGCPNAAFTWTTGPNGQVQFINTSTGTGSNTTYFWQLGNNQTSTLIAPSVTYTNNGVYSVTLNVINTTPSCVDTLILPVTVSNVTCNLAANFSYSYSTGGTVIFQNLSTGTASNTSYLWHFGNGQTSNSVSPVHTYSANTPYTVVLQANNNFTPACVSNKSVVITVNSITCTSSFIYSTQSSPAVIGYTSTSLPPGSNSSWLSSGGTPGLGSQSVHTVTYSATGIYTVLLTSSVPGCTAWASQTVAVTVPTCVLAPSFTWSQGTNGQVSFNNTSTGTGSNTTYQWTFGDGDTSYASSPAHTYTQNGQYTVTLFASNNSTPTCAGSYTDVITVSSNTCAANFIYSVQPAGIVSFTSTSLPVSPNNHYSWTFGNGSTASGTTMANTAVTYSLAGAYPVTLLLTSPNCTSSVTHTVLVNTAPCPLQAQFIFSQDSSGVVNFTNTSTGTDIFTTYVWNFGDGDTSNATSPVHTFSANGYFTVTLIATNFICSDSVVVTILVNSYHCNAAAQISHTVSSGGAVTFSNSSGFSTQGLSYYWDFGDGSTSTGLSTSHTYLNGGTHYVKLRVLSSTLALCADSMVQAINITGISCNAIANFTLTPSSTPQYWNAIPSYPWNVTAASWSWGDGNVSNQMFASHTYSATGNYNICLTVTASCGATATACSSYSVYRTSSEMVHVNVIAPVTGVEQWLFSYDKSSIAFFPNPGNGQFTFQITSAKKSGTFFVIDSKGEKIYSDAFKVDASASHALDLSFAPDGLYVLCVETENGIVTKKFVVSK